MKFKKIFMLILTAIFLISSASVDAKNSKKETAEKKLPDKKISAPKAGTWQPERKIGLLSGVTQVTLQMSEPCVMTDADTEKVLAKIQPNRSFSLDFASLKAKAVEIRGEKVQLKDLQVTVNGKKYFGGVRVNKNSGSLTVINLIPVEEYLRGVVPEEMSPSFQKEALKAQAVAARSFTLKNTGRHKSEGYDLCATTHCQAYEGVSTANAQTDAAVKETRGEILYYNGAAAMTNFHTDSGGMTESSKDVWGTDAPYLQAVEELEKQTQAWNVTLSKTDFSDRMGAAFGNLQKIDLSDLVIGKAASDRTKSGRIKFAIFVGSKKTVKMSGTDIRSKFSLPSTLCNIKIQGGEVVFEGFGRGHGVGMSQWGAEAYAKSGWTYDKILLHYYKGTEIKKLY